MKKIISFLFMALILILIFFAVTKVIKNIFVKNEEKLGVTQLSQPEKIAKKSKIYWRNDQLYVPYEFWRAWPQEAELRIDQQYILVESVAQKEFCVAGIYALVVKNRNYLAFENRQNVDAKHSKLQQYAKIMQEKLMLTALSEENYRLYMQSRNLRNCAEWIKLDYKPQYHRSIIRENTEKTRVLRLKLGKVKCFSSRKVLAISPIESRYIQFHENKNETKICFTGYYLGDFLVHLLYLEGIETLKLQITQAKGKGHQTGKQQNAAEKVPSFDVILGIPQHISGWKN